jgi:acetyl-CoA carboxylase biotin carboxyl carrier protein
MARERTGPPARQQAQQSGGVISIDELREILGLMQQSDIEEITIERVADDVRLQLRKPSPVASAPALISVAPAAHHEAVLDGHDVKASEASDAIDDFVRVTAQLVGRFHRGARPGAKALVEKGSAVRQGQVLGTIETLNVLTEVEAPQAGHVAEILAAEGQAVEYGQVLLRLDPLPA